MMISVWLREMSFGGEILMELSLLFTNLFEIVLSFVEVNLIYSNNFPFGLTSLKWLKSPELRSKSMLLIRHMFCKANCLWTEVHAFSRSPLLRVQRAQAPAETHSGLCRCRWPLWRPRPRSWLAVALSSRWAGGGEAFYAEGWREALHLPGPHICPGSSAFSEASSASVPTKGQSLTSPGLCLQERRTQCSKVRVSTRTPESSSLCAKLKPTLVFSSHLLLQSKVSSFLASCQSP